MFGWRRPVWVLAAVLTVGVAAAASVSGAPSRAAPTAGGGVAPVLRLPVPAAATTASLAAPSPYPPGSVEDLFVNDPQLGLNGTANHLGLDPAEQAAAVTVLHGEAARGGYLPSRRDEISAQVRTAIPRLDAHGVWVVYTCVSRGAPMLNPAASQ